MWLKNGNSMYNLENYGKIELKIEDVEYFFVLSALSDGKAVPADKIGPFNLTEADTYFTAITDAMNAGKSVWAFPDSVDDLGIR
ncbi:MAG: hypothetical protein IKQ39_03930 [Oscillospiraceae bacterium]|nr:hypothetical protein [Oscillospiraceae bacterium]